MRIAFPHSVVMLSCHSISDRLCRSDAVTDCDELWLALLRCKLVHCEIELHKLDFGSLVSLDVRKLPLAAVDVECDLN